MASCDSHPNQFCRPALKQGKPQAARLEHGPWGSMFGPPTPACSFLGAFPALAFLGMRLSLQHLSIPGTTAPAPGRASWRKSPLPGIQHKPGGNTQDILPSKVTDYGLGMSSPVPSTEIRSPGQRGQMGLKATSRLFLWEFPFLFLCPPTHPPVMTLHFIQCILMQFPFATFTKE